MYLVRLLEIWACICPCHFWGTCGINIQFHFSAGAILIVRYETGLIVYDCEIILCMARSLSMQKSIHIKITSSKHFSWYQIAWEDIMLFEH